jgi:hypothetical protein
MKSQAIAKSGNFLTASQNTGSGFNTQAFADVCVADVWKSRKTREANSSDAGLADEHEK